MRREATVRTIRRWMRALTGGVAAAVLLMVAVCDVAAAEASARSAWQVGYAEADITPKPMQIQMAGFGRERYARGAIAPLIMQVTALRDAKGTTALIITADVVGFDRVMVEVIKRQIQAKHGLGPEAIMLAPSHTHWGPAIRLKSHYSCGAPNVWYMAKLEDKIYAAVDRALKELSPATIDYGHIDFREIACSRRLYKDGKVLWKPNPEGSFDGHTPILRISRQGSPKQIVFVGHASHPTSSGVIEKWSPDFPGAMRAAIEATLPNTKAAFLQGCGGDAKIFHKDPKTGKLTFAADPKLSQQAGEKLARAALKHLDGGAMTPVPGPLRCVLATGQLSYGERWSLAEVENAAYTGSRRNWATWNARQFLTNPDTRESYRYDVMAWRFGDKLTVIGMEGEVCSPWGPIARGMVATPEAMLVGYVNNVTSYIPTARMMREGGYEASRSHRFFKPGLFTEKIEDEVKAIVRKALDKVQAEG